MNFKRLVLALALGMGLGGVSGRAAVFLELDGIPGESVDGQHPRTIEIQSWSWGASNSSTVGGGGGGTGKVSFQDISFTKRLDKASPILARACATGEHIKSAKLFVRKSGDNATDYYTITLSDLLVTSVSMGGSDGGELPTESISLNFTKIEWAYVPMGADGTPQGPVRTGYDLVLGQAL
jgi:type VI secretion system secreted protein Hcp